MAGSLQAPHEQLRGMDACIIIGFKHNGTCNLRLDASSRTVQHWLPVLSSRCHRAYWSAISSQIITPKELTCSLRHGVLSQRFHKPEAAKFDAVQLETNVNICTSTTRGRTSPGTISHSAELQHGDIKYLFCRCRFRVLKASAALGAPSLRAAAAAPRAAGTHTQHVRLLRCPEPCRSSLFISFAPPPAGPVTRMRPLPQAFL